MDNNNLQQTIDELLRVTGKSVPDLAMFMHERQRKIQHAVAKAAQPAMPHAVSKEAIQILIAELDKESTEDERTQSGLDYLVQTVEDCIETGDAWDLIFALLRVFRKTRAVMQPHQIPFKPKKGTQ